MDKFHDRNPSLSDHHDLAHLKGYKLYDGDSNKGFHKHMIGWGGEGVEGRLKRIPQGETKQFGLENSA